MTWWRVALDKIPPWTMSSLKTATWVAILSALGSVQIQCILVESHWLRARGLTRNLLTMVLTALPVYWLPLILGYHISWNLLTSVFLFARSVCLRKTLYQIPLHSDSTDCESLFLHMLSGTHKRRRWSGV